jgi:5'-nucleotidase
MSTRHALMSIAIAAALAACTSAPPPATTPTPPVKLRLLALNDFHGNLEPPLGGIRIKDPADPAKTIQVPAGGSEFLASALNDLRRGHANHLFVAAGDLVGATPLISALFRDEPAIESLSAMSLAVAAVGNHEFDRGWAELLRLQRGGCHPTEGCKGPTGRFDGAKFQYLAASTIDRATAKPILPAYSIQRFEGVPVAFIGLTLKDTPTIVDPRGVAGLEFKDEVQTVNALVPGLRAQGVEAIVVLIHEGGVPSGDYDECPGISGPIVDIVRGFDKAVDIVVSGHTHRAYNCRIDGRLVTSADKYGTLVTAIDLELDRLTRDVVSSKAANVIVRHDRYARDPLQAALVAAYRNAAAPLAQRVVGRIGGPLAREESPAGETALGQVVADAQLAATREAAAGGAVVALMNPGGLRADLQPQPGGAVRYQDLFAVQPFANNLVTMTLSGAELQQLLEQQWLNQPRPRILQVSRGFGYAWDAGKPPGQRIVAGSLVLDGRPIAPTDDLRVTVNSFLAAGGDNFSVLKTGRAMRTGMMDIDAFEAYIAAGGAEAPRAARIRRLP